MDAALIFPPGFRVTDTGGAPVSGARIRFFEAGTDTPLEVFSDAALENSLGSTVYTRSDGFPVSEQNSNTTVAVYIGTDAYKVDILDANGVTVWPAKDHQKGADDTSGFLTDEDTSTLIIPVSAIAVNTTISTAHKGKLINASGAITLTIDAVATLGDNWNVRIRCNDATNPIKLVATTGAFKGPGFSIAAFALYGLGNTVEIVCDGGNLHIDGFVPGRVRENGRVFTITDRISAAPATTPGLFYIVEVAFGAFAVGDIIEGTGQATFIGYTPPTDSGWLAYVQDENAYYSFQDSAWVAIFPAASDTVAGIVELAVQSEMETAADVTRAVVPGRQKFHPCHPKAFVRFNSAGTIIGTSFGVTSVVRNSAGTYTVTLSTAMSDANYGVQLSANESTVANSVILWAQSQTTTTFVVITHNGGSGAALDMGVCATVFGDM